MTADVVVIGGGPAGCSAAIRLARSGRSVRLYEKSHFPRAKLCGGYVSSEGLADLEDLGILSSLREAGAVSLHRTILASKREAYIESALPEEALSISRDVMDELLLKAAEKAGVDVMQGENGFTQAGGPCTVIAAGRSTPRQTSRNGRLFGIQALFRDVYDVTDQIELDLVDSGYVGLARQRHGINVCALTTQDAIDRYGPSLDKLLAHFLEENSVLRAHLKDASRIGHWMAVGPVRLGIRQLTSEKTFYMGDAACVVDPFAGEGISIALYSSNLLVRALDQAGRPASEAYAAMWKEAFRPALRWNAAIRLAYSLPIFREPVLRALQWYPQGMDVLTDLTRYRPVVADSLRR